LAHGHSKDYERLLATLSDISAWLEPIGMEANTFADSQMVGTILVALYVHIIEFWAKACVVYSSSSKTRLFGAFKSLWKDYDEEFVSLKSKMDADLKRFLASTTAVHHQQFASFSGRLTDSTSDNYSQAWQKYQLYRNDTSMALKWRYLILYPF